MELDDDWTGSVELKIALDHPQGVFYPGNQVAGKVLVSWNEPKIFLGLRVKCEGTGLVFFTDRSAGFRRKFSNDESYLAQEVYLIGDGESPVSTEGGQNEFPFSIDLPEEIPGSFEGRYGRVRYSVSAFLDLTKVVRITSSLPFTVVPVLDLNQDSLATLPISEDNSKVVVGQTEPLNMLVTLPVRGFVPGQTIPVKIVLNNVSNVEIRKLRVVFKKVITYHTHRKSRRHKEIIVEIELPVTKSCQVYETGVDVPAVPPTGLKFCSIIDVWYTLKVEACVEVNEWYLRMLQKNLKTRMRIVVGTIPLRHYETPEEESPGEGTGMQTEVGNIGEKPKTDDFAENPSLYEESKIYPSSKPNRDDPPGDEEAENGSGNTYAPLYRVYTFNKSKRNNHASKSNH